jgi:hypothetical protein
MLLQLLKTALRENECKTEYQNVLHNTPGSPVCQIFNTAAHFKKSCVNR